MSLDLSGQYFGGGSGIPVTDPRPDVWCDAYEMGVELLWGLDATVWAC